MNIKCKCGVSIIIATIIIAERLSARHVIAEYCVEIVCLYICIYMSRLGMQSVHMARPIL